jgi:hypothetical protein
VQNNDARAALAALSLCLCGQGVTPNGSAGAAGSENFERLTLQYDIPLRRAFQSEECVDRKMKRATMNKKKEDGR